MRILQYQHVMQKLVNELKSGNPEVRNKAAKDLYNFVSIELREVPADELNSILDEFNQPIYEMMVIK